mmetsp:Transcript_23924/g.52904  ORF Transcript_23924/g.52904 Transcript_23924/m.52904 type:complete len:611 (-) Transcript_23924:112-1944(-)
MRVYSNTNTINKLEILYRETNHCHRCRLRGKPPVADGIKCGLLFGQAKDLFVSIRFVSFRPLVMVDGIPDPQVDQPFLSLDDRLRRVLRKVVHVSIGQLAVEQDRLAHLGLDLEGVEGLSVDVAGEGRLPTLHVVVQVKQDGGEALALPVVFDVGIAKVVVRRVFLRDVVVDELEGFREGTHAVHRFRVLVGAALPQERLVDPCQVGGPAVDGVDDGRFFPGDPRVFAGPDLRLSFHPIAGAPLAVASDVPRGGLAQIDPARDLEDVVDLLLRQEVFDFENAGGDRQSLQRHVHVFEWFPGGFVPGAVFLEDPRVRILQDPFSSDLSDATQRIHGREAFEVRLSGGDPVLLPEIVGSPHVMQGRFAGRVLSVIGKVGSSREGLVLLVEQERLLPLVVGTPFLLFEVLFEVSLRLLGVAFHEVRIVNVQVLWIVHDDPLFEAVVGIAQRREKEPVGGECSGPAGREGRVVPHQVRFPAPRALPVKIEFLVGHVDELSGKAVEGGLDPRPASLRGRAVLFPVEGVDTRFDVDHRRLRTVTDVVGEFFEVRIGLGLVAAGTPGAGRFVRPHEGRRWLQRQQERGCGEDREGPERRGVFQKIHRGWWGVLCYDW